MFKDALSILFGTHVGYVYIGNFANPIASDIFQKT